MVFYPFFVSFFMVFLAELGDKTQLLVLSFSNRLRIINILLGVAIGTFLSHGLAIIFGSKIASLNSNFSVYLSIITYSSFILFGVFGLFKKSGSSELLDSSKTDHKVNFLNKISSLKINYLFIIAFSIFVGEFGDKTFLASLGLGLEYPDSKIFLILGSILGMVCSNLIAIFLGRFLGSKFSSSFVQNLSNFIFIAFGVIGFFNFFVNNY